MMDTRELILEKSRELFFKRGYSKTSLSEIAVECGISKGGLYHHFERKEDLFIESIISIFIDNERIILSSIEKDIPFEQAIFEFLENMISIRKRYAITNTGQGSHSVYFGPLSDAIKMFPEIRQENRKIYEGIVQKVLTRIILAQESGEIKKEISPYPLAVQFCSIYEGLPLVSYYIDKDFDDTARTLFSSFWELIKV